MPADQIVKGYPYSAEQCVALTEEDLATLEPTDDKTIHLEHFLSPTEFDLTLLAGRSLYLAPAHPAAMKQSRRHTPCANPRTRSVQATATLGNE